MPTSLSTIGMSSYILLSLGKQLTNQRKKSNISLKRKKLFKIFYSFHWRKVKSFPIKDLQQIVLRKLVNLKPDGYLFYACFYFLKISCNGMAIFFGAYFVIERECKIPNLLKCIQCIVKIHMSRNTNYGTKHQLSSQDTQKPFVSYDTFVIYMQKVT